MLSRQSQTKPAATKPASVTIKPQRMGFSFDSKVPRYWLANNRLMSHTMNAMSLLFPQGETFFVDSVRAFREQITDPAFQKEISGFIGQEAMHSLEHVAMNQHVRDLGMPTDEIENHLKVLLDALRLLPKRHHLAITCALEHLTAMLADLLLERDDIREDMHETMRPLWVWHAIEETEHKGVAYDLYQAVDGSNYAERTGWLVVATLGLAAFTLYGTGRMMLKDPAPFSLKDTAQGLWRMWGWNGAFSSLTGEWLKYFKPGFHPWQNDNSELINRFKDQVEASIAPQYRKSNRSTGKGAATPTLQ
ncbi:MAG: metal-dependent hydrolase [Marinobacter sp.]|nr:metal-dependent hydrolase [Marinobacter sp.]